MSTNEPNIFAGSLQRQLQQLVRAYELCNRICLAQHGVTPSQGYTLLSLPEKGSLTMNELSDAMGLANSTMTRLVDQIVHKELVHRKPDDDDRRIVRIELTGQGQKVRRTLEKELQDLFKQSLDEIPEEERPVALRSLERVTSLVARALKGCCTG